MSEPDQGNLPLGDDNASKSEPKPAGVDPAEHAKALAELNKLRDEKKAAADKAKLEDGKTKEVLAEKMRELEELKSKFGDLERFKAEQTEKHKARVDAAIKELPEAARKEIELVREALSIDKLEELVTMKAKAAPAIGAPTPGGSRRKSKDDANEVHDFTHDLLRANGDTGEALEVAKHGIKVIEQNEAGNHNKFRWRGTGDNQRDALSLIETLKARAWLGRRLSPQEHQDLVRSNMKGGAT